MPLLKSLKLKPEQPQVLNYLAYGDSQIISFPM